MLIPVFLESLHIQYSMEPYSDTAHARLNKLNGNNDWLWQREGLSLPILSPTTLKAQKYYFSLIDLKSKEVARSGKKRLDFVELTQIWNQSADSVYQMYVTPEVLEAYAKGWEKSNNIRASEDLIRKRLSHHKALSMCFLCRAATVPTSSHWFSNSN